MLACMHALYDAADDDSATGGPDLSRRIYPVLAVITADGFRGCPTPRPASTPGPWWRSGCAPRRPGGAAERGRCGGRELPPA